MYKNVPSLLVVEIVPYLVGLFKGNFPKKTNTRGHRVEIGGIVMNNLRKPQFYQNKLEELLEIQEELREITSKLRGISNEFGYPSSESTILDGYVIGYLRGITGDEPTIMMSLNDVIDRCEDLASEDDEEEEEEGHVRVIAEVFKDAILEMKGKEGLVCLGTGGDVIEWIDGVNGILYDEGITENQRYFSDVYTFIDYDIADDPINCIFFPFTKEKLDLGRLAIVRLQYSWMKWFSDYVSQNIGDDSPYVDEQDYEHSEYIYEDDDYECEDDATYYDEEDDCPISTPEEF